MDPNILEMLRQLFSSLPQQAQPLAGGGLLGRIMAQPQGPAYLGPPVPAPQMPPSGMPAFPQQAQGYAYGRGVTPFPSFPAQMPTLPQQAQATLPQLPQMPPMGRRIF